MDAQWLISLLYKLLLERETRFELATSSLEGWSSTNWATPAHMIIGFISDTEESLKIKIKGFLYPCMNSSRKPCSNNRSRFGCRNLLHTPYLQAGGGGRIRTSVGFADRFTVCSLWPLGNPTVLLLQMLLEASRLDNEKSVIRYLLAITWKIGLWVFAVKLSGSANAPRESSAKNKSGASEGTRTPGPLITNQLLYQLSYAGRTT